MWALEHRQGLARSLRSRAGWRLEEALKCRQRLARSLRSRAGWRLEEALECRQRINHTQQRTNKTTLRPTISPFADIDGRRCEDIEAHQAHERNNTAATDIDYHRYRRRRMWGYQGSSGTRTLRPPLTPTTTPMHPHIGHNRA